MKINQKNAAGNLHGCFVYYHNNRVTKHLSYKVHFYNGKPIGHYINFNENGYLRWESHYINEGEIGCEQNRQTQYFYKTPNKKFGEQITWK